VELSGLSPAAIGHATRTDAATCPRKNPARDSSRSAAIDSDSRRRSASGICRNPHAGATSFSMNSGRGMPRLARLTGSDRASRTLIGSLTTEKTDPKDANLLVTATAEADLTPLARLGRRLQGRARGRNRGGEVFPAVPGGNNLGRLCPWK
jgi:hypothetical protein